MPRKTHSRRKPAALPPMPWETTGATGTRDGRGRPVRAPLARKPLAAGSVAELAPGPDGAPRKRSVTVWRTGAAPMLAGLPEAQAAALATYADALHRLGASEGFQLDGTSGCTASAPSGPSLSRLAAARIVACVRGALGRGTVSARPGGPALSRLRFLDLMAVEEASAAQIARRLDGGATRPSRPARTATETAAREIAAAVADAISERHAARGA